MRPDRERRRTGLCSRRIVALGVAMVVAGSAGCGPSEGDPTTPVGDAGRIEVAPLCPWRHPSGDCAAWFPGADRSEAELQILSALRAEIPRVLGRDPTPEDHARYVHRVLVKDRCVGEVVIRRVRGESGSLEVVVALSPDGTLVAVRLQRAREPAHVLAAVEGPWLASFRGLRNGAALKPGVDLPVVPAPSIPTAEAIAGAVRAVLATRELAADPRALRRPDPHSSVGRL